MRRLEFALAKVFSSGIYSVGAGIGDDDTFFHHLWMYFFAMLENSHHASHFLEGLSF